MKINLSFALLMILSLCACDYFLGPEIARLEINEISTKTKNKEESVTLSLLKGDEIMVWSQMDMRYSGEVGMYFDLYIYKDDVEVEHIQFDPRKKDISVKEVKTDLNGNVVWKFQGKNGRYTVKEDGDHTFKGSFFADESVDLKTAEIYFRK